MILIKLLDSFSDQQFSDRRLWKKHSYLLICVQKLSDFGTSLIESLVYFFINAPWKIRPKENLI